MVGARNKMNQHRSNHQKMLKHTHTHTHTQTHREDFVHVLATGVLHVLSLSNKNHKNQFKNLLRKTPATVGAV